MKFAVIGIVILLELMAIGNFIIYGIDLSSMIFGLFMQAGALVCASIYFKNNPEEANKKMEKK